MTKLVKEYKKDEYEVTSDGRTVWVNEMHGCIARFSATGGIDIHQPPGESKDGVECLYCTHEPTTLEDWRLFKQKLFSFYRITVDDVHMPGALRVRLRQQSKEKN